MPPKQEITREKVLSAALEVMRGEGIEAVTSRSVAKALKCSTQPIYSVCGNMDELKLMAYDRAMQYAEAKINGYQNNRYVPLLCRAIGFCNLANEERNLFRSLYLSDFSRRYAAERKRGADSLMAAYAPGSTRLKYAGRDMLDRILSKLSVFLMGLSAMINTGALSLTGDEAAERIIDIYETLLASEHLDRSGWHPPLGAKVGAGANADVYEYGPGKVVKLFRDAGQKPNMEWEWQNSLVIQQTGLPVPRVFGTVEIDGLPGIVYEKIEGVTVAGKLIRSYDPEDVRMLARLLHGIHSVNLRPLDLKHIPSVKDSLAWQIGLGTDLTEGEKRGVLGLLQALPEEECLCHGDLNPMNVIIRGGEPCFIDWQGASVGCPCFDVMQLMLLWKYAVIPPQLAPADAIENFYAVREDINRTFLDEYIRLSGRPEETINAWLAPVAAAKLKNNLCPAERDALLGAIRQSLAGE